MQTKSLYLSMVYILKQMIRSLKVLNYMMIHHEYANSRSSEKRFIIFLFFGRTERLEYHPSL